MHGDRAFDHASGFPNKVPSQPEQTVGGTPGCPLGGPTPGHGRVTMLRQGWRRPQAVHREEQPDGAHGRATPARACRGAACAARSHGVHRKDAGKCGGRCKANVPRSRATRTGATGGRGRDRTPAPAAGTLQLLTEAAPIGRACCPNNKGRKRPWVKTRCR